MITLRTFKSKASTTAAALIIIMMLAMFIKEGNYMITDVRKEPDYK